MIPTDPNRVMSLLERNEEGVRAMAITRANRLGRLIDLDAPDFVIARELRMVMEALEALFRKHDYNPTTDERVIEQ